MQARREVLIFPKVRMVFIALLRDETVGLVLFFATKRSLKHRPALRILRLAHDSQPIEYHKSATNVDGYRIDATKNFWVNSLKVDSASTDVVWGHGRKSNPNKSRNALTVHLTDYDQKLLTSAKNGELILWDLNRSGHAKYGK